MGRTTVGNLIARGQNWNSYNNTGISTNALWTDAFNAALADLAEDIGLIGSVNIPYVNGTVEYDLPSDFFEVVQLTDSSGFAINKRELLVEPFPCSNSYFIFDAGTNYKINFDDRNATETLILKYIRYPALVVSLTDRPEVPTVGEDALLFYAISRALRNNNQQGQAVEVEALYEKERKKIRDAKYRAMAGW